MAHFYGVVQGNRQATSRLGSKQSGMSATAASWDGAVRVNIHFDEAEGVNKYTVSQIPWHGKGVEQVLATGTIGE